jgi:DNA-binding MarR family transcriptional regulator
MDASILSSTLCRQAVDSFWETYPPLWRIIQAHIRQVAAEQFDITVEQFHMIRHIRRGHDSVSKLAEARNISRPAVSKAVDLLANRGLIVRTTDPQDRRHMKLDLTAEGNTLMDAIYDDTRHWMIKILEPLDASEIQALIVSMEAFKKII